RGSAAIALAAPVPLHWPSRRGIPPPMTADDDYLPFVDDALAPAGPLRAGAPPWRVLVVDDDPDVHESTGYALRGLDVGGRPFELLHARAGADALAQLRREADVAVILLDVVMETEHAGLDLVGRIRDELGLAMTRIILRTGQPGHAPELETI